MDEVPSPKELKSACQLFQEVSDDDLIETTSCRVRVLPYHVCRCVMSMEGVSFFDEVGQVSKLAELHDKVNMGRVFFTIDEGNDVWMVKGFQDVNFGIKVLFQLPVKLV